MVLSSVCSRSLMTLQTTHLTITSRLFFLAHYASTFSTLSLHDALPILLMHLARRDELLTMLRGALAPGGRLVIGDFGEHLPYAVEAPRSEEHTSELQSRGHLVCRLLLEKKKIIISS